MIHRKLGEFIVFGDNQVGITVKEAVSESGERAEGRVEIIGKLNPSQRAAYNKSIMLNTSEAIACLPKQADNTAKSTRRTPPPEANVPDSPA